MNGVYVTVQGIVGTDPKRSALDGQPVISFRMVSRERKWSRAAGGFVDGHESWVNVRCFRDLARNVDASIHKGDRVLIHGKLQVKEYTDKEGTRRASVDVDADAAGPDLQFGTTRFSPNRPPVDAEARLRAHADELSRELDEEPRLTVEELVALGAARAVDRDDGLDEPADDLDDEEGDDDLDGDVDEELGEDVDDCEEDLDRSGGEVRVLATAGR